MLESLLVPTGIVALAEIGDKTQLLALLLAVRAARRGAGCSGAGSKRPLPAASRSCGRCCDRPKATEWKPSSPAAARPPPTQAATIASRRCSSATRRCSSAARRAMPGHAARTFDL